MATAAMHPYSCTGRGTSENVEYSVLGLGTFLFSVLEVFQGNLGASWIAVIMLAGSPKVSAQLTQSTYDMRGRSSGGRSQGEDSSDN